MAEKTKFIADADGKTDKRKPSQVLADQLSGVLRDHKIINIKRELGGAESGWTITYED